VVFIPNKEIKRKMSKPPGIHLGGVTGEVKNIAIISRKTQRHYIEGMVPHQSEQKGRKSLSPSILNHGEQKEQSVISGDKNV